MKKTLLIALSSLVLATGGCVDNLKEYNIDVKNPSQVPGISLVANAQRTLARTVTSTNVNLNPFRLYSQYWTETTYTDESNYDIKTRQIDRSFWDALYAALGNLNEAKRLIPNDKFSSAKVIANQQACTEIMAVYAWSVLVNTYGNVPYTEALDFTKTQPKYDDAKTIYNSLFTRLDAAIAALDPSAEGLGSNDIIYNGDVANWKRFGNSLKLRLAMTIADDDLTKARTLVQQAAPGVFTSLSQQAQANFVATPPNTNPLYEDLVQSGRHDFVGTTLFVDTLKGLNDPRLTIFFNPAAASGTYEGGENGGDNSDYPSYSEAGEKLREPTLPGVLLSYSEVEFLLAEAAARGFTVTGTVTSHYNAAVTASILEWGGSAADASAYLAQRTVAYATAPGTTYREKIGFQKWISLYDQPVMGWTEWRRLDTPRLVAPAGAKSDIPLRLTYPTPESNLNTANYQAASSAIGGDKVSSKLFWDKF
ncbi:SusD/RagB family nutrient-binding outer membrane lipoprotein [Hymenobacter armeniacus]|uniref:SusD/RagB family nutrient-binding outer membrane lipoprotein n=1 Tax=Hymenobacter armeniacus TaxID=2771358 RepID=A0ABR8JZL2_9BACT|nr:SusD/RagB family nutrient-binding outer membrane lipoprotein [Hymenobacter armeniacus]MBD2724150.1 SusD/RagB family nutrient-binding outer membrane lipoprotein [Hymenobacter armeniacus]